MRKPSKKLRIHDYDLEETMASNDDLSAMLMAFQSWLSAPAKHSDGWQSDVAGSLHRHRVLPARLPLRPWVQRCSAVDCVKRITAFITSCRHRYFLDHLIQRCPACPSSWLTHLLFNLTTPTPNPRLRQLSGAFALGFTKERESVGPDQRPLPGDPITQLGVSDRMLSASVLAPCSSSLQARWRQQQVRAGPS